MATKTKKKQTKSKGRKKAAPAKKAAKKKLPKKKPTPKKLAKKKPAPKKPARKKAGSKRPSRQKAEVTLAISPDTRNVRAIEGAGDLQGLSNVAGADSESVDELLEEGNSFEAEAVKGVQDADDHDEQEVHTHELPEDDVPEEYLDKE
jgi:hypothetical protein